MPKLRQWSDDLVNWQYVDVSADDVRLLNTQDARSEVSRLRVEVRNLEQERDEARLAKSKAWDEVAALLIDLAETRTAARKIAKERDDAHAGNWGFLRVTDEIVRRVGGCFSQESGLIWTDKGIRHGLEQIVYTAPADKVRAFEKLDFERKRADAAEAEVAKLQACIKDSAQERDQAQDNRDRYQGLAVKHYLQARKLRARVSELEARP